MLLFTRTDAYLKEIATAACFLAILVAIKKVKSQSSLPLVLLLIPALWYALLGCICLVKGMSWGHLQQDLAAAGWISEIPGGGHKPFWKVREFLPGRDVVHFICFETAHTQHKAVGLDA